MQIFVHDGQEQLGPYDPMMLRAALAAGDLSPDQHCWHEGLTDWTPLKDTEFADALPQPPEPEMAQVAGHDAAAVAAALGGMAGFDPSRATEQMRAMKSGGQAAAAGAGAAEVSADAEAGAVDFSAGSMPMALAAGLAASLVAGIVWSVFMLVTGFVWGVMAALVGVATGVAVGMAKGERTGPEYSAIAAGCALLGSIVGFYALYVEEYRFYLISEGKEGLAQSVSVFSLSTLGDLIQNFSAIFYPIDILFVGFAVFAAWGAAGGSGLQQEES